jgi:hypothetical protein
MKRSILFLIILIIITGGVFGQDNRLEYSNEITVEVGVWSVGIRYDRFIGDWFSLGVRAFIHGNFINETEIWSIDFIPRLVFPFFISPYLELGIGYGKLYHGMGDWVWENTGLILSPGIGLFLRFPGVAFPVGDPNYFVGLSVPVKFGTRISGDGGVDYYFRVIFGVSVTF